MLRRREDHADAVTDGGFLKISRNADYLAWLEPNRIRVRHAASGIEFDDLACLALDESAGKSIICAIGSNAAAMRGLNNIDVLNALSPEGAIVSPNSLVAIVNHAIFTMKKAGAKTILAPTFILQLIRESAAITDEESEFFRDLAHRCGIRKLWATCDIAPLDLATLIMSSSRCRTFEPAN